MRNRRLPALACLAFLAGAHTAWPSGKIALRPVAPVLRGVRLRFHELDLCQGLDAVFVFHDRGMEVWCQIDDEKSYQRLLELVEPLRASFEVSVYPTRPPAPEKKGPEDKDPPPSIWNNAELREYLQDPFTRGATAGGGVAVRPVPRGEGGDSDLFLKQRLLMFTEQTLDWGKRMKRYAVGLPELAAVGADRASPAELRNRAVAVCRAHAQEVDRYAERLMDNIAHALPKATRRVRSREETVTPPAALAPPEDAAGQLAGAARSIARRVYRFVHPMSHTVGLVDLREPSLLDSLKTLRRMAGDFQRSCREVSR